MAARPDFVQVEWNELLCDDCRQLVRLAVREDLGRGQDWSTVSLVPAEARGSAAIVARQSGIVCGLPAVDIALDEMHADLQLTSLVQDGQQVEPGQAVARLEGSARDLLTTERIVLNLLGHLSGIATLTRQFVTAVEGTSARIYDTRKTTPGWRRLEKYATRCGGAYNHRTSLADAVLIKDNHLAWWTEQLRTEQAAEEAAPQRESHGSATDAADLAAVVRHVRQFLDNLGSEIPLPSDMIIEIEVDTLEQLRAVLPAEPDLVLLDNMLPEQLREAVEIRNRAGSQTELEASGGIQLERIARIAATGVDRISVGALTHSAVAFDLGLDWGC